MKTKEEWRAYHAAWRASRTEDQKRSILDRSNLAKKKRMECPEYRARRKEREKANYKKYLESNRETILVRDRLKYQKRKHLVSVQMKNRRESMTPDEKSKSKSYWSAYFKKRRENDIAFKLKMNLRCRAYCALRSPKSATTKKLLGIGYEEFRLYIESLWKPGMSWDNYGRIGWHIDHIRPCCSFNLIDPEEQRKCFHYTNMQPLWAEENLRKNRSYSLN